MACEFPEGWRFRMTGWRKFFILVFLVAVGVMIYRLVYGLGAATHLNDQWPWGWWIAVDVLIGVALAGGGYSTAFLVHILHRKQFAPVARAALLTSMLGYILVLIGLFMDIGRWYNFWRPFLVYPGSWHSVLFEVFWCISLYTTVQVLEFGSIVFERVKSERLKRVFDTMLPPLFILGVVLPTLHQSSLGSLYVVTVDRLDPLWWSLALPIFFLLSSFFVGPAMVTLEGSLAAKAYGRQMEIPVLSRLVKVGAWVMFFYLVFKLIDLGYRNQFGHLFDGSLASNLFLVEMIGGVLIPMIMFAIPSVRNSSKGLITASILTVAGVILNRMNVVFTGMAAAMGGSYFPKWTEFMVTAGLIAFAVLAYCFLVENFAILPAEEHVPAGKPAEAHTTYTVVG
ncbi:Polysulphide reductase NrfD [Ammonifex degensii KC4]|uniref:Polysulphide reductase NrfD n=1 Tax=Ammonifex degensii (strain DSM 10501 / KC4) TaxID=429009 RepID=C9RB28_AMMDK|nr:Ni/Fe-hydrogenase cytochrome b subunit [Ammonifex degensii]ACX51455.1 Polysulphide reductase NrfD [Ammonifex degensii KC4]